MSPTPLSFAAKRNRVGRCQGFALLITITLLAFLVLLLVSLASLTRIETQVATNSQQLSQARQNALMALNIAIGQLQKQTGPDQRITAKADLLTTYSGSPAPTDASTAFDTFWHTRNRAWTGTWGNQASQINYTLTPSQITGSGTSPTLLGWLVSGNEGSTFALGTSGQTTGASAPKFTPDLPVSGLSATTDSTTPLTFPVANTAAGTSTTRGVLMVGPASASDGTSAGKTASFNAGNYVVVPIVDIKVSAQTIPGFGTGTSATTIGGYGYWIGDEGVKARANLRDSYLKQTAAADKTTYQRYSFITSQRSAVELVNYDSSTATLLADFPFNASSIDQVQMLNQLSFTGTSATAQSHLQAAAANRFHDLTTTSRSVLSDTYAGGLKKDLTADVANTSSASTATRPADSDPIFTPEKSTDRVPTWGMLRSFPRTNPTGVSITPSLPTTTSQGIYPVINFAALGLDFYLDDSDHLQVALYPIVVLWNPHATTLTATNYEIGFHVSNTGNAARYTLETSPTSSGSFTTLATLDLKTGTLESGSATTSGDGFLRFRITGVVMPPGETQIYRLGSTTTYSAGTTALVLGSGGLTNYASWTIPALGGLPSATVTNGNFRVRGLNPGSHGHALDVVLAKPGQLTNLTSRTGWYQVIQDARMGRLGSVSGSNINLKESVPLASMPSSPPGATSSLFISEVMESRGGFNSSASAIGALGSGRQRWLVMGNPRAPIVRNTSAEIANGRGNILFGANLLLPTGSTGRDTLFPYNGRTNGYRVGIGGSQDTSVAGWRPAVLFDVLTTPDLLLSLGQLQHASLGAYGFHSAYPFSNSWADVRIARDTQYRANLFSPDFGTANTATLYDLSWHLNRALWDKYFVSGVPSTWLASDVTARRPLPNVRMSYYTPTGTTPTLADIQYSNGSSSAAYDKAASNLMVDGGFNINSTSEQAWRALLAATFQLPTDSAYADSGDNVSAVAPIPRFSGNQSQVGYKNTMTTNAGIYLGNRGLQLASSSVAVADLAKELARTIVAEIRTRGPFLSMADFVNRRITTGTTGVRGAIQTAIDNTASTAAINDGNGGAPVTPGDKPVGSWNTDHYLGSPAASSGTNQATRFVACPKFLTQADLLSLLGPALSPRSDTFLIRTYGETTNPTTGEITGRAWCEATVQRVPDYIDSTANAAETPPGSLNSENRTLGRRYVVTSFRWLSPTDI
jgi:hypothetical protein